MEKITLELNLFNSSKDFDRSIQTLLHLLEALTKHNTAWLVAHPETPSIYEYPMIYREDGKETWSDIPTIVTRGVADCEDLACGRAAEYRVAGINAKPILKKTQVTTSGGGNVYHCLVKLPDGRIEDPSRALGMSAHEITRKPIFVEP